MDWNLLKVDIVFDPNSLSDESIEESTTHAWNFPFLRKMLKGEKKGVNIICIILDDEKLYVI